MNNPTNTIAKKSRHYQMFFRCLAFSVPWIILGFWMFYTYIPEGVFTLPAIPLAHPLPMSTRLLGAAVSMAPGTIWMLGFLTLSKILGEYAKNTLFSHKITQYYKNLGIYFYAWVPLSVLYGAALSVALTLHNPPGERTLQIAIGTSELAAFILGSIILILAAVMDEAYKLKEEQDHTV